MDRTSKHKKRAIIFIAGFIDGPSSSRSLPAGNPENASNAA
jgi:hypothetical protein